MAVSVVRARGGVQGVVEWTGMNPVYEAMHPWCGALSRGHIDESHHEIDVGTGRNRRRVLNQVVQVRGDFDGVPVVVSWEQYFSRDLHGPISYTRNVLDVFVAAPEVTFDGKAVPRTLWRGFLSRLRGQRIEPFKHDLFTRYLVSPDERGRTPSEMVDREFCARLHDHLESFRIWEIQFQAAVGHSSLLSVPSKSISADRIRAVVESGIAVYAQ